MVGFCLCDCDRVRLGISLCVLKTLCVLLSAPLWDLGRKTSLLTWDSGKQTGYVCQAVASQRLGNARDLASKGSKKSY